MKKTIFGTIPYKAQRLPIYVPIKGYDLEDRSFVLYPKNVLRENRESDDDEEPPLCKINLPKPPATDGEDEYRPKVKDHSWYSTETLFNNRIIGFKGLGIKDYKIFHIWDTRFSKKPHTILRPVKFETESKKIEMEIVRHGKDAKVASFTLNVQDCDEAKSVKVDDELEVDYTLFSEAVRVKLEMRAFYADGRPADVKVQGYVRACIEHRDKHWTHKIFKEDGKHDKSERAAGDGLLRLDPTNFILPRDCFGISLDIKLTDKAGEFKVRQGAQIYCRTIACDQHQYIFGDEGYIILRIIWGCVCVDQGKVCTCGNRAAALCFPDTAMNARDGNGDARDGNESFASLEASSGEECEWDKADIDDDVMIPDIKPYDDASSSEATSDNEDETSPYDDARTCEATSENEDETSPYDDARTCEATSENEDETSPYDDASTSEATSDNEDETSPYDDASTSEATSDNEDDTSPYDDASTSEATNDMKMILAPTMTPVL